MIALLQSSVVAIAWMFPCDLPSQSPTVIELPNAMLDVRYEATLPLASWEGSTESTRIGGRLPPGLNHTGHAIAGVPTEVGMYEFRLRIVDAIGQEAIGSFRLQVVWPSANELSLRTDSLPECMVFSPYDVSLLAEGGYPPFQWSIDGNLPDGLRLDGSRIVGRVEDLALIGEAPISVTVQDRYLQSATANLRLVVVPDPRLQLELRPSNRERALDLPAAVLDRPYSLSLSLHGGVSPLRWSIDGEWPAGLDFNDGVITGTPNQSGEYGFVARVQDAAGQEATQNYNLTVLPPLPPVLSLVTSKLENAQVGEPYLASIRASGGIPPYRWQFEGNIPPWLRIDNDRLYGTPEDIEDEGTLNLKVTVQDSRNSQDGPRNLELMVRRPGRSAPFLQVAKLPLGFVQSDYHAALVAAGGVPPLEFQYREQTWNGLRFGTDGHIQGRPLDTGDHTVEARVLDRWGQASAWAPIELKVRKGAPKGLQVGKVSPVLAIVGQATQFELPIVGGVLDYIIEASSTSTVSIEIEGTTLSLTANRAGKHPISFTISDAAGETLNEEWLVHAVHKESEFDGSTPDTGSDGTWSEVFSLSGFIAFFSGLSIGLGVYFFLRRRRLA